MPDAPSSTELFEDLSPETLLRIFDALPVDVSFVDADDTVTYFNLPPRGRIFPRTKMDIGRKVQRCHPPKSVHVVQKILDDFRAGRRESADFWLNYHDMFVSVRYFPVRSAAGEYLGTLEVTQEIGDLKKLEGEKRILDDEA